MTQGDRELIERLRAVDHMSVEECFLDSFLFAKAADRLEALLAEMEMLRDSLTGLTPENLKAIPEWMDDFHILPLDVIAGELRGAFQALKGANNG